MLPWVHSKHEHFTLFHTIFWKLQNQGSSCQEKYLHLNTVKTLFVRAQNKEDSRKKKVMTSVHVL